MHEMMMSKAVLPPLLIALLLAGCAGKAPTLPDDPIDKAASCGVVAAATARATAGVKGDLPAEAQEGIFHYPLLAGSTGKSFDDVAAQKVFQRMPKLFDTVVVDGWETLKPACAAAFPQTEITQPTLPAGRLDSMLQCYVVADFMRKSLGSAGGSYGEASMRLNLFTSKLDAKMTPVLAAAGLKNGPKLQEKRAEALAAAARMGQPQTVIAACMKKYG